ncbi:MAG TPA: hypothetical protein VF193_04125 [Steroidobacter sp.]
MSEAVGTNALQAAPLRGGAPAYVGTTIWAMLTVYLLVDAISGAFLSQTGGVAPLSQVWKAGLLLLLLYWSSLISSSLTAALIALIAVILIGPLMRVMVTGRTQLLLADATSAVKTLLPALVLLFCCAQRLIDEATFRKWAHRVLWFGMAVVLLNIGVGLAGFGYTAYGTAATGGIGIIGFFYAGNEVGATYVVLSAFVLLQTWLTARHWYLVVGAALVGVALLITTKSAVVGSLALAFGIPIATLRGRLYRLGWKAAVLYGLALAVLVWAALEVWTILEVTGLAARIASVLAERGWVGVLFSGRELYVAQSMQGIWQEESIWQAIFGPGPSRISIWSGKPSTETDPLDLYFWFGVPGFLYCILLYACFIFLPWRALKERSNAHAPGVLLANILLVALSIVGGHVVLSGMVGMVWAVLTSLSLGASREPTTAR